MTCLVVLHDNAKQFLIDSCKWWAENRSFTIRPDMVYVFLIRHLAQRELTADDL